MLTARLREQLALLVAQENRCAYCLAAHTTRGARLGLGDEELAQTRRGEAADTHTHAVLTVAREIMRTGGDVDDAATVRHQRERPLSDEQRSPHVDGEHALVLLRRRLLDGGVVVLNGGVVHQDVQRPLAESLPESGEQGVDVAVHSQLGAYGERLPAGLVDNFIQETDTVAA